MYVVRWKHRALTDLRAKVKTPHVRKYLIYVSRTSLHRHFPLWGGTTVDRLLWRRGVTEQDEIELDAAESHGIDLDDAEEHSRDFVLVYHRNDTTDPTPGFEINGVLTNGELVAGLPQLV